MAKDRKCIFCGKAYQYCPTCKEFNNYPTWMAEFDSERCHDLYEAVGGYRIGTKTKDDIKNVLDKHNITDYSEFSKGLQSILNELFPKAVMNKPSAEHVSDIATEVLTDEPVVEEPQENFEQPVERRSHRRMKIK